MTRVILILLTVFISMPAMAQSLATDIGAKTIAYDIPVTETLSTEAEVEGKAGLPQFDTSTFASQLFWLAISFGILYFFFARKTLPAISSTLETRQSTIKNDLDQADALSLNIEKTRTDYEIMIAQAKSDAANARANVEQSIREKNDEQSTAFNEKSMEMINDIEERAQKEQNRIKTDLEDISIDLVDQIIAKLTNLNLDKAIIKKAVHDELNADASTPSRKKAA